MQRARWVLVAALLAGGCASDDAEPSSGENKQPACVVYEDRCCQLQPAGLVCSPVGDGSCYFPCTSAADCKDPSRPFCSKQCLCQSTDTYNVSRRVCRAKQQDDCNF